MRLVPVLAILLIAGYSHDEPGREGSRPNVILFFMDDVGIEAIGTFGSEIETPNLDRMAAEGMRFENAHATPLCTPSRVRLMTGRENHKSYVAFGRLPPHEKSFGQWMRASGYRTAVMGKWQLMDSNFERGLGTMPRDAGFDEFRLWQVRFDDRGCRYWNPTLAREADNDDGFELVTSPGEFGPRRLTDFLLDFIARDHERPFFAYYPMILGHDPFVATPDRLDVAADDASEADRFAAMVQYIDTIVGETLDELDRLELSERTLVLFLSDNGTHYSQTILRHGKPVRGAKGETLDASTHIPMIARWPGTIAAGSSYDGLVDLLDIAPTLATLAGVSSVEATGELDGYDLVPVFKGAESSGRETIVMDYAPRWHQWPARFAFDERLKLYADGRIYDTDADPEEQSPLTEDALADVDRARLDRLRAALDELPGDGLDHEIFAAGIDDERRAWLEGLAAPWLDRPGDRPTIGALMRESRGQTGPLRGVPIQPECEPPAEPGTE